MRYLLILLALFTTTATAQDRVVAIGDLHGDLLAAQQALQVAGVVDEAGQWNGGTTILVQTGDILDRGDDERAIIDLFQRLKTEAAAAGGQVIVLNGNHELMNAMGDLRYITPGAFAPFTDLPGADGDPRCTAASLPDAACPRLIAFLPGGEYARQLAEHPLVAIVGDTVFVHGSLSPQYAPHIAQINADVQRWLRGDAPMPPLVTRDDSPTWNRSFGVANVSPEACEQLDQTLKTLTVARMVVGHTVQPRGVTSACGDKVWRIDTGLSRHYSGPIQVLEIAGGQVRILQKEHQD